MKSPHFLMALPGIALLTALLGAGTLAAQNPDSPAVSSLLQSVERHAALAEKDADTLAAYTNSNLNWRSHGRQLNLIRGHANNLIRDGNQLSAMRNEASPWQQEAIDRITVLLPEMSSHLTSTINHLNDNLNRTQMKPYRDLAITNRTIIHKAHEIIADFVDYGEAKSKAESLERQLQLSSPDSGSSS